MGEERRVPCARPEERKKEVIAPVKEILQAVRERPSQIARERAVRERLGQAVREGEGRMRMPFLTGALIGLAVGGVVALLLAPSKGIENRQEFRERLHEAVEAGRKKADEEAIRLEAHYHEMVDIAGQKQP